MRPAWAQTQVGQGQVTIFTDGLAYPNGRISRALTELSVVFDQNRKLRVLPIMGVGGESNVRDLLQFRGVDLAIMNNDVLAAPSVERNYPDARRKLRFVTRLYSQKVFLLARPDITAIEQLAGKKVLVVGHEAAARLTASTIFSLLKVKAELVHSANNSPLDQISEVQAIFFLEDDMLRVAPDLVRSEGFAPLPISAKGPLASVYRPALILAQQAAPYSGEEDGVNTISVDTILAAFDWIPTHGRYPDVTAFIDGLFAAIPRLRKEQPNSIWSQVDPRGDVLGWKRYSYADSVKKLVPVAPPPAEDAIALAPIPALPAPQAAPTPVAIPAPGAAQEPTTGGAAGALRLSIVADPPLTDQRVPGGGLIAELTAAALQRSGPTFRNAVLHWEKDRAGQLQAMLTDQKADIALPWEEPSCEDTKHLRMETAAVCDGALISAPLFKVLVLFFMNTQSDFNFTGDESLVGRTICLPADRDLTSLTEGARSLVETGKLTLVRPGSLIDCLSLVQRGDADAVLTSELEGKLAITRLGLGDAFRMADRPLTTKGIHMVLPKEAPGAEQRLAAINNGIAKLKSEDAYLQIIAKNLSRLQASR
jgi:hypothetical protein